ncbi:hypothetical protein Hanom_Chr10g00880721 [Helianthus anomalus]
MVKKTDKEAGGISKFGPMDRTNVVPCLMKSVLVWAISVLGMNVAHKTGIILTICFVCSTCVTGHRYHSEVGSSTLTAALSRNLYVIVFKEVMHSH